MVSWLLTLHGKNPRCTDFQSYMVYMAKLQNRRPLQTQQNTSLHSCELDKSRVGVSDNL